MSLKEKICIVTAAGQGIGRAAAELFHQEGAIVYASDINEVTLNTLPSKIYREKLDVTNSEHVKNYCSRFPKVDVLFNVAGWVPHGTVLDTSEEDWNKCMDINVTSIYRMVSGILPTMIANGGGSIINTSSVASSKKGVPLRSAYSTSKAAVLGLTKSIAADYVKNNIRCNAILPGTVDTPSLRVRISETRNMTSDAALEMFMARQPTGRFCTAVEVAQLAVYLASDKAAFITGSEHVIDGGWSI